MEHVGATLRKMREEQGLTLEDVARRTRIRAEILRGLEEGDHHQISEGPFLRGFVKSYAQSLGKSEQEIEDLLSSIKSGRTEAAKQPPVAHQPKLRAWYSVGGMAVVAVVVAVLFMDNWGKGGRGYNKAPAPAPPQVSEVKASVQTTVPPSEPVKAVKTAPSSATSPAAPPVHLEIKALELCWVRVLLDEEPSRSMLLAAGEIRSWEAKNGGTLTLGNAGGVVVLVNGREYANLGGKGKVLRDIAVTPEGLRLPKEPAQ